MGVLRVVKNKLKLLLIKNFNNEILAALKVLNTNCANMHERGAGCAGCLCHEDQTGVCIASVEGIKPMEWDLDVVGTGSWHFVDDGQDPDDDPEEFYDEEDEDDEFDLDDRGTIVRGLSDG